MANRPAANVQIPGVRKLRLALSERGRCAYCPSAENEPCGAARSSSAEPAIGSHDLRPTRDAHITWLPAPQASSQHVSTARVHSTCPQHVSTARVHSTCPQHVSTARVHSTCPQPVPCHTRCVCLPTDRPSPGHGYNAGFYLARPSAGSLGILKKWTVDLTKQVHAGAPLLPRTPARPP